ncbi:MAG: hypothetical protein DRR16_30695 [Candidatus Parabeggiatoa sp. nov. 3]|nr:MAG: hypothetical protein DRR00_22210 [Gammaproteobacteria bacterium]RKZ62267.1 MAG: hypothetical protein DRQ99_19100 [Gammaproteobacteria bacterium]RKZ76094.1 MAG: hypothetical protein DRR16_30695 [Gammaproteobacteria bacterium]HEW98288.1 hypothetical protein [Beggiatoa sp.]
MSEYAIQIPDSLLAVVQEVAEKNSISVNQFFLTAVKESLATIQAMQKHKHPIELSEEGRFLGSAQPLERAYDLSERWENYFALARKAPDEFMANVVD